MYLRYFNGQHCRSQASEIVRRLLTPRAYASSVPAYRQHAERIQVVLCFVLSLSLSLSLPVPLFFDTHTYIHICTSTIISLCIYIYTCMSIFKTIYIYIYTHIYIYIYTYTALHIDDDKYSGKNTRASNVYIPKYA